MPPSPGTMWDLRKKCFVPIVPRFPLAPYLPLHSIHGETLDARESARVAEVLGGLEQIKPGESFFADIGYGCIKEANMLRNRLQNEAPGGYTINAVERLGDRKWSRSGAYMASLHVYKHKKQLGG